MLCTAGLQGGADSPLLSGPLWIYKAQHQLLWLSGTSCLHKLFLLNATRVKKQETSQIAGIYLFYSTLLSSFLFNSTLLY